MKNLFSAIFILCIFAGCGSGAKKDKSLENKVNDLQAQVLLLQQSVEMQSKEIKSVKQETSALKTALSQKGSESEVLRDLQARMNDLEGSGYSK